jgi:hypothetical protein
MAFASGAIANSSRAESDAGRAAAGRGMAFASGAIANSSRAGVRNSSRAGDVDVPGDVGATPSASAADVDGGMAQSAWMAQKEAALFWIQDSKNCDDAGAVQIAHCAGGVGGAAIAASTQLSSSVGAALAGAAGGAALAGAAGAAATEASASPVLRGIGSRWGHMFNLIWIWLDFRPIIGSMFDSPHQV